MHCQASSLPLAPSGKPLEYIQMIRNSSCPQGDSDLNGHLGKEIPCLGFPGGAHNLPAHAEDIRDKGLIPGSGILQYYCLENSVDRRA